MRHFFGSVFVQEDDHIELEYYIQENGGSYGIEIKSSKPTHSGFASYSNITTNYDEIVNFILPNVSWKTARTRKICRNT